MSHSTDHGASYTVTEPITEASDPDLYHDYCEARGQLSETLGDLDSAVAEYIVEYEDTTAVPATLLHRALRTATAKQVSVHYNAKSELQSS